MTLPPKKVGKPVHRLFTRFARNTSDAAGHYVTFMAAVALIVIWALSGPFFGFSQVWQLVINTGTTIITFLMVFLIQNTQNRDSKAIHLKLDELINALNTANDALIPAEDATDEELNQRKARYAKLAEQSDSINPELTAHTSDGKTDSSE